MFHRTSQPAAPVIGHPKMKPAAPAGQYDDHVWRFRNEEAGDPTFARRCWSVIPTSYGMTIDINATVRSRMFDDQFDDNQFSNENGDGEIY